MAHIHEKIDFTAEVFIVHKGKVLLRMHDKYKIWLSVGGHIELDEDPNQAAIREVKEEVGLDVKLWDPRTRDRSDGFFRDLIPPVAMGRHAALHPSSTQHEHVVMVFFATSESAHVQVHHAGDRSDEWKWLSAEELEELDLTDNVRAYARWALEVLAS